MNGNQRVRTTDRAGETCQAGPRGGWRARLRRPHPSHTLIETQPGRLAISTGGINSVHGLTKKEKKTSSL